MWKEARWGQPRAISTEAQFRARSLHSFAFACNGSTEVDNLGEDGEDEVSGEMEVGDIRSP